MLPLEIITSNSHMPCLLDFQAFLSHLASKTPEQFDHLMKTGGQYAHFHLISFTPKKEKVNSY